LPSAERRLTALPFSLASGKLDPLAVSLGVALVIRVSVALSFPNVYAPDEVFQFLEQAHRLVFGQGIVPWEFQVGLRSWLIPLLLAGPMALAHLFVPNPIFGLMVIRVLLCVASLSIVWCATKWGERFYGRQGALIAGLFSAFWPDLWLMAPHPLEEVLSADVLVPAVYLVEISRHGTNARQVAWAGLLLGITFSLREQLAPTIAVVGIFLCARDVKRWCIAVPVAAIPVLCVGMLDWLTWGQPFRSFWLNPYLNVVLGVAKQDFGTSPSTFYLFMLVVDWLWALPFMIYLAWQGGRRLPVAATAAVVTLIVHSMIAHKEFRFILPAIGLIVPLAGVGIAGAAQGLSALRWLLLVMAITAGPYISPLTYMMLQWQDNSFKLFHRLADQRPCLISLQGWSKEFLPIAPLFEGNTRFTGRTINIDGSRIIEADAIVGSENTVMIPAGFVLVSCVRASWIPFNRPRSDVCLWRRPVNACDAGPVEPFSIVFPAAAAPFIVRDRLTSAGQ
jgi:hypothetical protein